MPHLRGLTDAEQKALIHKIRNDARKRASTGQENLEDLYKEIANKTIEKKLATVSEEARYEVKNRYRH